MAPPVRGSRPADVVRGGFAGPAGTRLIGRVTTCLLEGVLDG